MKNILSGEKNSRSWLFSRSNDFFHAVYFGIPSQPFDPNVGDRPKKE